VADVLNLIQDAAAAAARGADSALPRGDIAGLATREPFGFPQEQSPEIVPLLGGIVDPRHG
jgi:hypothetical protein